ncbi:MAG: helix-turn-helix transcriptional regulator, partial [Lachnospiraceae bacterium]|nr:helix-turn-helix transcriptional regulator [Lachnospiraceae bacterium]
MIKNLKSLRKEKGISQKSLGEVIGVSQQSINKYENY